MSRRLVAAAAVVSLAISGCGSSSLSAKRLGADATTICGRAALQADRIQPPHAPTGTAAFLEQGAAALTPELAQLRRLKPAAAQKGAYATMLGALESELQLLTTTANGLDRGADPQSAIKTLQERLAPVESDEAAASRQLQIPACMSR